MDSGRLAVMAGILIMSFGTAFMSPVIQTSIRRFTPLKARSTGFNIYYLLMNISAVIANVFLIEFSASTSAPWTAGTGSSTLER